MNKAERLLQLLVLLRGRRRASTASELATRLGVSERTVYRDMQSLLLSGVNIQGEAGVGYTLREGNDIPPLMFDENELEALMLGMRLVKGWADDELIAAVDSAQQKIMAVLPGSTQQRLELKSTKFLVPDHKRQWRVKFAEQIRRAIDDRLVADLIYVDEKDRPSSRAICPLGLLFWGDAWTLVAWCLLRDDYRLFRLDRMQELNLRDEQFEIRDDCSFGHYVSIYEGEIKTGFWDA